ncbi:DUF6262 family protein [Streptomyces sp. WAC 06783]|uniref:DUF6262 family protein n=1 Tax=Streptomyces sp. WAC 06783 TaxID=2203211 RepID=UPI0021AD997B|nr:DUF6262 family protein [Streptomyces sp. WAC 06783]
MTAQTAGIVQARRTDTARRRERVLKALDAAVQARDEISVSGIARRAGVDRTFLYRHRDLLGMIHTQAAEPPPPGPETVSRPSLMADLANAQDRNTRLAEENRLLRERLSAALGEEIWREAGLGGATASIDQLLPRVTELEQETVELRRQLEECQEDLDAARAVNREYLARFNTTDTIR